MRRLVVLLVAMGALALPATALAHATLIETSPQAGAAVPTSPKQVVLSFDDQIRPVQGKNEVLDSNGDSAAAADASVSPDDVRTLVIPLKPNLAKGTYTVRWTVVSTDGHLVSGTFAFGLGGPPVKSAVVITQGTERDWPFLIARFCYFLGLLMLVGGAFYRIWVWRPAVRDLDPELRGQVSEAEGLTHFVVLFIAGALVLIGGWAALVRQASELANVSFLSVLDGSARVGPIFGTRFAEQFGRGLNVTGLFAGVLAIGYLLRRRPPLAYAAVVVAAVLGGWALAAPGLSGHADDPGRGVFTVIVDALHVAATAVWVGGLVQLFVVTPAATGILPDDLRGRVRGVVARRFSTLALASVVVISATGVGRALWEVGALSQLWTTGYGRTLLVKTALLGVLVLLGYLNRQALGNFRQLRRRVGIELGVVAALIAAVSLLTDLPPANSPSSSTLVTQLSNTQATQLTKDVTIGHQARAVIWPGQAGANALAVELPVQRRSVKVVVTNPDGTGRTVTLPRVAPRWYASFAPKVQQGTLQVQINAGTLAYTVRFPIGPKAPTDAPSATPLLTGQSAAAEAGDLAVGVQRSDVETARLIAMTPLGTTPTNAIVTTRGQLALPCTGVTGTCYTVDVPEGDTTLDVRIQRPGKKPVSTRIDLPGVTAPAADSALARAGREFSRLRSLRSVNVLASSPTNAVRSIFTIQAPNRIAIEQDNGARTIIIAGKRYDQQANGTWKATAIPPVHQPSPFWAQGASAVYLAAANRRVVQLTSVIPATPAFFRLWIDRRTGLLQRIHMVAPGHFMSERELDFNKAPPVEKPPVG